MRQRGSGGPEGRRERTLPLPQATDDGEALSPSRCGGGPLAEGAKEIEGRTTMANNTVRHINIIGHQNPDTDSICSALAYAWLKNRGSLTGLYEARRAGHVNRETRFVLQHFGVEPPRLCRINNAFRNCFQFISSLGSIPQTL